MKKNWKISAVDSDSVLQLQSELGISPALCEVLVRRGILNLESAKTFFRPQLSELHDPFIMKDMVKAVSRILFAQTHHEHICVYGDYDVDGTTSVSLLYDFLRKYVINEDNLHYYLPDRNLEGYGLSLTGIQYAAEHNCQLMILVDCGIKDVQKIAVAVDRGIDVIIIDHHIPSEILPDAVAILNPQQIDCPYPYKELSACGLVYKFITAIESQLDETIDVSVYLDWVTLSIASDIVPITGENRILAYYGLKKINDEPSRVVQLFKDKLALNDKVLSISDLVFKIGPKINASGRMTHAKEVVKLFTSDALHIQEEQLSSLFSDNKDRQTIDKDMTDEIFQYLDAHIDQRQKSIVVHNPHWHKGILGIVASRIVEKYYKPTIVLTESNGVMVGSARSVQGFDLYEAIYSCGEHLNQFGGHAFAAGMTLEITAIDAFKKAFEDRVSATIQSESLQPFVEVDAELTLEQISANFMKVLYQFEPCGPQNSMPIFLIKNLYDTGYSKKVKDVHAQMFLTHNPNDSSRVRMKAIAFNQAEWIDYLQLKKAIDVVCHIEKDSWNGQEYINLRIIDVRPSA